MSDPSYVLDASAVLALLNREAGHETVSAALPASAMGSVNLAEVISKLCERGMPANEALQAIRWLGIEQVAFTESMAVRVGDLRPLLKPFGLSLGDRACLALAWHRKAVAMTADRLWDKRVAAIVDVQILLIR